MENTFNAKVLLVDDEEEFISTLSQRLETRNLNVTTASSGQEAVELTDQQDFDAILLDITMPGMDGIETLKRIKEKHPEAEIIMLTGHGSIASTVEAMKSGAEDYLEKPVDMSELLAKIKEARDKHVLILQRQSKEQIKEILKTKFW